MLYGFFFAGVAFTVAVFICVFGSGFARASAVFVVANCIAITVKFVRCNSLFTANVTVSIAIVIVNVFCDSQRSA